MAKLELSCKPTGVERKNEHVLEGPKGWTERLTSFCCPNGIFLMMSRIRESSSEFSERRKRTFGGIWRSFVAV